MKVPKPAEDVLADLNMFRIMLAEKVEMAPGDVDRMVAEGMLVRVPETPGYRFTAAGEAACAAYLPSDAT